MRVFRVNWLATGSVQGVNLFRTCVHFILFVVVADHLMRRPTRTHTSTLAHRKKRYCVHTYVCIVCRDMFASHPSTSPAGLHAFLWSRPRTLHCRQTNKHMCTSVYIHMCVCACILSILFYVHLFTVLDSEICTAGSDRQGTELTFSQIANEYVFFSCDHCRAL